MGVPRPSTPEYNLSSPLYVPLRARRRRLILVAPELPPSNRKRRRRRKRPRKVRLPKLQMALPTQIPAPAPKCALRPHLRLHHPQAFRYIRFALLSGPFCRVVFGRAQILIESVIIYIVPALHPVTPACLHRLLVVCMGDVTVIYRQSRRCSKSKALVDPPCGGRLAYRRDEYCGCRYPLPCHWPRPGGWLQRCGTIWGKRNC
jgi:hypothetical protein